MRRSPAISVAVLAALGGCSLAPHYERPATPTAPDTFKEAGDWKVASPADTAPRGQWWQIFQDPELDALEARATDANQSLKAAFARLEQAKAQTRIERSALFPSLDANAGATRERVSYNSPSYTPGKPATGNLFSLGGSLSYELDLFGRVRNTVANARYSEQASAGDVAGVDLAVHAELATDYFTLRGLDVEQLLLDQTVSDYAHALQLTENLYKGGASPISDVQQAQAQLETARTQAEDTRLRREQTEHAIAVLVGQEATAFSIAPHPAQHMAPLPTVDPGLPSELLERRPDVAAAERRVAAANANIGVARAAFFPVFSLFGTGGYQSVQTTNWFNAPSLYWSIGPQAMVNLFDAGRRRAESAQAHAFYDENVADYRGAVLTAYQDVEDNLAALRQLQLESISQASAVKATQGALDQANLRYKGGIVTYLEVVSTENAALAARLTGVDIEIRRASATVLLVRALGGDWKKPTVAAAPAAAPPPPASNQPG